LLIDNNLKDYDYSTTRKINIILTKENEELNIITIFPGKFAPALPDTNIQTEKKFNISKEFWDNHRLSSFNNFELIENKIIEFIKFCIHSTVLFQSVCISFSIASGS
jgi:hypothetical protein